MGPVPSGNFLSSLLQRRREHTQDIMQRSLGPRFRSVVGGLRVLTTPNYMRFPEEKGVAEGW